ncbi:MAG: hypothetical protein IT302_11805 [Dehalococcoidia bacterium]|nr:hypothetical protein [Dehalococcoidia bacterium]
MRKILFPLALAALSLAAACGGSDSDAATGTAPPPASTATAEPAVTPGAASATAASASPAPLATAVVLKPTIEEALSCRVPRTGPSGQAGQATPALQRHDLDTKLFPNAICNDGSPAILFFRPYEGEANRDKWVIGLAGGGACASPQECADRWCGVDTNFNSDNMSTDFAGNASAADGIFARRPENPFANWNHVFVRYCSSDMWAGRGASLKVSATDPSTGKPVEFAIAMTGSYVIDAALATLKQGPGIAPLTYVRTRTTMPDLDNAREVVFAGGSAGGLGIINNLDRVASGLRSGPNPPVVRGLIDSATPPDHAVLGWEKSAACIESGVCSRDAWLKAAASRDAAGLNRLLDQSCIEWHARNRPGTEWECIDTTHVLQHHLTTPYFVRMGLTDRLISAEMIDGGFTSAGKPLTLLGFATLVHDLLEALPTTVAAGEERAAITVAPGVFAPSCPDHYTIYANETVYDIAVGVGGRQATFFETWNNWVAGKGPTVAVSSGIRTDKCR